MSTVVHIIKIIEEKLSIDRCTIPITSLMIGAKLIKEKHKTTIQPFRILMEVLRVNFEPSFTTFGQHIVLMRSIAC